MAALEGADSAHHFETPVRASFAILPSFETIPLMTHGRRPRIQKMKCLAQKLTKWWRIEKLWQKCKIERFTLCKSCYWPSTKCLSFRPGWLDFAETGLLAKSQEVPLPQIFRTSRNYVISKPWADSEPPVANRVKLDLPVRGEGDAQGIIRRPPPPRATCPALIFATILEIVPPFKMILQCYFTSNSFTHRTNTSRCWQWRK